MSKVLTVKDRKKLARLKLQLKQLEDKAYKMDGQEFDDKKLNDRYNAVANEVKMLLR